MSFPAFTALQWLVVLAAVWAIAFGFWRRLSLPRWILLMVVVGAIIFATLVIGIAGHGDDMKRVGRLALKSLIYFEIVTTVALFIGLAAVNITKPGVGIRLAESAQTGQQLAQTRPTASQFLEHAVPTSIIDAMAKNEVLQIVFWSILFAIGLSQVRGRPTEFVLGALAGLAETVVQEGAGV